MAGGGPHLAAPREPLALMFETLQSLGLAQVLAVLLVLLVGAAETGNWLGRTYGRTVADDTDAGNMATATLGLLALLIAFTYAMALERYDLRREVVLQEANAISSTANFALMRPQADQAPIMADLREYTELRMALGAPYDPDRFAAALKRSGELRADLWRRAVAAETAQPQSLGVYQFVWNLSDLNNMGEKRVTALRNHVPVVVSLMLAGTALVAMAFSGYGAGVAGVKRRFANLVMALLVSTLIALMLDLQRPARGTILVPTQPLQDALDGFPRP